MAVAHGRWRCLIATGAPLAFDFVKQNTKEKTATATEKAVPCSCCQLAPGSCCVAHLLFNRALLAPWGRVTLPACSNYGSGVTRCTRKARDSMNLAPHFGMLCLHAPRNSRSHECFLLISSTKACASSKVVSKISSKNRSAPGARCGVAILRMCTVLGRGKEAKRRVDLSEQFADHVLQILCSPRVDIHIDMLWIHVQKASDRSKQ